MQWQISDVVAMVLDFMLVLMHAVTEKGCITISHSVMRFYAHADECNDIKVMY